MNRKLATTIAATASAAAIALTGASTPAFAYPPGTGLSVSTNVTPVPLNPSTFTVTVSNAQPNSTVTVRVNRTGKGHTLLKGSAVAGNDGTATFTFKIYGGQSGSIDVKAEAKAPGYKEKASTTVAIEGRTITAPTSVDENEPFDVTVTGYKPRKKITVTATRGKDKVKVEGRTDENGSFTANLKLKKDGVWAIVATSDGRSTVTTVTVLDD
jgi:hypothetical protein